MRAAARGEQPAEQDWKERVKVARRKGVSPLWLGNVEDVPEEA
jgi:hypothetical protein